MKRLTFITILLGIGLTACGTRKEAPVVLDPGTPAYELGKSLAAKVPQLDPDSNLVLISTDKFDISAGEALRMLYRSLGKQADQLTTMSELQIRGNVKQTAERLALQKVLWQAARDAGFDIDTAETDSILNTLYLRNGGEDAYMKLLEENGVTIDFVRHEIGVSTAINNHLEDEREKRSEPSEKELKDAYNASLADTVATVRHILLLTNGKSDAEKAEIKKKMGRILVRARSGEDFAKLATEFTEDPGSKDNGGLYENFDRATMVKPFSDAAFTVPVGKISGIVETTYGYHILKIIERGVNSRSYEESKEELRDKLVRSKGTTVIQDYIDELKQSSGLEFVGW